MSGKLLFYGYVFLGFTLVVYCTNVRNSTGCYGTKLSLLNMNCPSMNVIAVWNLSFVAKPKNESDCKAPITDENKGYCCKYQSDDCIIDVFSTKDEEINFIPMLGICTGQRTCNERVQWIRSSNHCISSSYFEYTTYLKALYECVPENQIIKNSSTSQSAGEEVYIQNAAYPNVTGVPEMWECSVETNCSASIVMTAIDVNLTCGVGTIDCNHNNNYEYKQIYQSSNNFLLLNINVVQERKLWIKLSASDSVSSIDVRCGVTRLTTAIESCITSTASLSTAINTEETTLDGTLPMESITIMDTSPSKDTPTSTVVLEDTSKTTVTEETTSGGTSKTTDQFPTTHQNFQAATLNTGETVGIVLGMILAFVIVPVLGCILYKKMFKQTKELTVENKVHQSYVRRED